jgi:hypothetical protein
MEWSHSPRENTHWSNNDFGAEYQLYTEGRMAGVTDDRRYLSIASGSWNMNDNVDSMKLLRSISADELKVFSRCHFIRRTFRPYPCLAVYDDETGQTASQPYRGQAYDPALLTLIEDGWDHEHCEICQARITDGIAYWTNDGPEMIDLCQMCFPKLQNVMEKANG